MKKNKFPKGWIEIVHEENKPISSDMSIKDIEQALHTFCNTRGEWLDLSSTIIKLPSQCENCNCSVKLMHDYIKNEAASFLTTDNFDKDE